MLCKIFDNGLIAIRKIKFDLMLNKPAYIGVCILELSKVLIYESHYDLINNKYGNSSRLLFTDTNSLMYEIKAEDVYEDFSNDKEMFHVSNYSTKSKYYNDLNKLLTGKMKDKTAGVVIEAFIGLNAKIYSLLIDDNSERKKAKGVN